MDERGRRFPDASRLVKGPTMLRMMSGLLCVSASCLTLAGAAHANNASFFLDGATPSRHATRAVDPYAAYAEPDEAGAYAAPSDADIIPSASPVPREIVEFEGPYPAGTIVVSTKRKRLYLVLPDHQAIQYGVGVGRPGFEWAGAKTITAKREWPDWTPPAAMLRRRPDLPRHMAGGLDNPLGARAMYLGSSEYRIHGSNEPDTIGQAVSSGCIRMTNDDVADLYDRVRVGTRAIIAP